MRYTTQVPASCYVTISTEADSPEEALSNFKNDNFVIENESEAEPDTIDLTIEGIEEDE